MRLTVQKTQQRNMLLFVTTSATSKSDAGKIKWLGKIRKEEE